MRTPVLLALALALAACKQSPPGKCSGNDGCGVGQECAGGVCVRFDTDHQLGSRCIRDGDCVAWGRCAGEVCALAPGHCLDGSGCEPNWQRCSFETFTCVTAAGFCAGNAECQGWQTCGADHVCATAAGRCAGPGDCDAWETCSANNVCALAAGKCNGPAECAAWESCDASHTCALAPGRCRSRVDCGASQTCNLQTFTCAEHALAQSDILIVGRVGTLAVGAWAPLRAPNDVRWDVRDFAAGVIDPSNDLVYAGIDVLRFAPDALIWDAGQHTWKPPVDPAGNDAVLAGLSTTPGCVTFFGFRMQAGTGALLRRCNGDFTHPQWYDSTGRLVASGYEILAWDADGYMLGLLGGTNRPAFRIFDPTGATFDVSGLPTAAGSYAAARVVPGGFRVAMLAGSLVSGGDQLWRVAHDGSVSVEGTFCDLGYNQAAGVGFVIGDDGALYSIDNGDRVLRRPLAPGTKSIVYDVANRPIGSNDPSSGPGEYSAYIDRLYDLVTAP